MDLEQLYAAVPAAQEEDLLAELVHERQQAALDAWLARHDVPDEPDEPEPDESPLTPGQVLGLVQHLLGAVVLPDSRARSTLIRTT